MSLQPATSAGTVDRGSSGDLAEVVGTILDKGVVIDAHVSVGLIGIKLLTIDARIVVASVDTYLRFAEATNRLTLDGSQSGKGLPEIVQGPKGNLLEKAGDALGELVSGGDDRDERDRAPRRERRRDR
ncbi:gas vesicle protein GvpJ [Plantactinospora siamensis]|uniref:gas vesicle protein GvpJ n=1 Tax=Plantactinospora siamensis TaxID=555372 RepID=UPI00406BA2CA